MTSRSGFPVGLSASADIPSWVECSISSGLPGFELVGLPDAAVRESRERVRAAIKNSGFRFPVSRITLKPRPGRDEKRPARSTTCRSCSAFLRRRSLSVCRVSRLPSSAS